MTQTVESKRLKGKTAFVTGAASGIGRASALLLAQHGANIVVADREEEDAAKVRDEIEAAGGRAIVACADISEPEAVEAATAKAIKAFGSLDIVFANAGINGVVTSIEDMKPEEWSQTVDINLKGTFLTVKYAVPHLKKQGGSIIITSSINGNRVFSNFGFSAYSSTKAAQVAFMKMAALELAQFGIRVNAICPGAIDTHIGENTFSRPEVEEIRIPVEFPEGDQPLSRGPGAPEQVADLVLFLASQDSAHISGTEIYIDGTESLLRG